MSSDGGAATSWIGVTGALGLSVTSSVAIVICNKHLISSLGFFFATTLTSWHLGVTFITLHVAQRLRFFEPKPVDVATVVSFGMLNGIFIGLLNLCLGFNSMTKLAIIPFTMLLETIFLDKKFSQSIKASVVVLLLGVGISSVTDLQLNLVGSIISALSIVATCVGQIRRLEVSSTQLLYQPSPYQSAVLLVAGPFVDKFLTKRDVFAFHYTFPVVAFIVLSCSIAVCVNLCTFLVIGTTSPVTFQVLGHLKTCLVLSFGYVLLRDPFTARNVVGIVIAVFGMGLTPTTPSLRMSEKDSAPLLSAEEGSPWPESTGEESFDYVPRTAKSAFAGV
nr:unnamed protein product [Digitaria exilis]